MTSHQGRTEHDSLGDIDVPADALWGASTQRAVHNFQISGTPVCPEIVYAPRRLISSTFRLPL